MNSALRRARGGPRFGRGLLLTTKAASFSPSSSSSSLTHKFLSPPSSSSSHNRCHLTALRLQSQFQTPNQTRLHHPTTYQPHQRPLLRTTFAGSSRRTFSFTSAFQASNQVAMAEEWSAERVRAAFIGYFKENGHTFGLLLLALSHAAVAQRMLSQFHRSALLVCRSSFGPDPTLHECGNEPVQGHLPWNG